MGNVNWASVYDRYRHAVHSASEPYGAAQDEVAGALVLDVRRSEVFKDAPTQLKGASWHDPAQVDTWVDSLPSDRDVVVYCVYGHEVSRATAMRLRASGLRARFLRAGIDGWQAAGRDLETRA